MSASRILRPALVVCLLFGVVGCLGQPDGPVLHSVSGVVKFDAEPLSVGEIIIRDTDGKRSDGAIIAAGQYSLRTTAGKKVVEITAYRDVPGKFHEANPGEKVAVREQFVPAKYNKETSLTVDVSADSATASDFELTK